MTTFEKFLLVCHIILWGMAFMIIGQRNELRLVISGQETAIESYKQNLTECLKETKLSTQEEFTGE